jgi:hypothetical protein
MCYLMGIEGEGCTVVMTNSGTHFFSQIRQGTNRMNANGALIGRQMLLCNILQNNYHAVSYRVRGIYI